MSVDVSAKVQFIGWMDVKASEWEGVGERDVKDAIDEMDEDELRLFLKMNFVTVQSEHEK